jgi:hypothetical protein
VKGRKLSYECDCKKCNAIKKRIIKDVFKEIAKNYTVIKTHYGTFKTISESKIDIIKENCIERI